MTRMPADPPVEEPKTSTSNTTIANTSPANTVTRDYSGPVVVDDRMDMSDPAVAKAIAKIKSDQAKQAAAIQNEHWLKTYWRPMMGWLYMLICFMDFIGFPVMAWMAPVVYKAFGIAYAYSAWQPITLIGGGMVHMSFGAVLGITAWTRGVDKVKGQ